MGLAREKDGQAVTSKEERYVFAPSLDWQLGERTLLNLNLFTTRRILRPASHHCARQRLG